MSVDLRRVGSLMLLLMLWQAVAITADSPLLPDPVAVVARMVADSVTGELPYHLGATLARVAASFVLAFAIGAAIGVMMGRYRAIDRVFDGWLIFFLNLPALVTIILAYVWLGLGEVAAIAAVAINKIPNVAATLREGARTLDGDLAAVAKVYGMGRWRTLRHVVAPQLVPFALAAVRTGLALIWKIVLVVELLGRSNGVGFQIHMHFQMFDVTGLLAYALAFILVVQAIELFILGPVEARLVQWR
ncbi:MAG: ABC transporter permease [Rhodospirillaceae bacterium BRH_c57]|nr:MAG: ABC transporter permease [Rhodospirillaceae bacterium BRH_c57]